MYVLNIIVNGSLTVIVICRHSTVVVVVCFHDLKLRLSSQLKAASCARCSSEMQPPKQVNGHSFVHNMPDCLVSSRSQSGEAM